MTGRNLARIGVREAAAHIGCAEDRFEVRMCSSGPGMYPSEDEWVSLYHTKDARDADLFKAQVLVYEAIVRGVYSGQ